MTDKAILSGNLKRKLGFLSMWRNSIVEIKATNILIHKGKTPEVEFCLPINPETEVIEEKDEKPPKFQVKTGQDTVFFQTDTLDTLLLWVQAIRTITFRSKDISIDDFNIISVIGRGFYGKVMLVENKYTKEICALKTIHKARLIKENKVQTVLRERNILVKVHHPFIVQIKFAFQNDKKLYIGLEYVPGGELFHLMQIVPQLSARAIRLYVAEVALALDYIHSLGVIYRDLKPENVLIDQNGHIKLTDFGLAKVVEDGDLNGSTKTFCGTNEYLAPEIVKRELYTYAIDWWALGILTYELMFGQTPFYDKSKHKMYNRIINDEPFFPPETDPEAVDFVKRLLRKDPKKRAKLKDIKSHPFFRGMKFEDVLALKVKPQLKPRIGSDRSVKNFDSEFTQEAKIDSSAINIQSNGAFNGFSYIAGDEFVDSDDAQHQESKLPDSF